MLAGAGRNPNTTMRPDPYAHLMPERLRASFGLPFGEEERRSALPTLRLIRRIYPVLPTSYATSRPTTRHWGGSAAGAGLTS